MSRVVVFGGTGYAGGHIARELVARGHQVVAVSRRAADAVEGVESVTGSVNDADFVRDIVRDADQVVVAIHAHSEDGPQLADAVPALADAAIAVGARLSFVGGAGSLQVAEGGPQLFDTPDFSVEYKPEAKAHGAILDWLRTSDERLDWFYVSPAASFGAWNAGERTGTFRLGGDVLLTDASGDSSISGADYAIAYVDEMENHAHPRQRFSVAY